MLIEATSPSGGKVREQVELNPQDGYSGVAQLKELEPSTDYQVEVSFDGELRRSGRFKTFPEPGQARPFTMLLNSCNFHGWGPFRNNREASQRRAEIARGVDFAIHAGDQVYADKAPMSFTLEDFRQAYARTWGDQATQEVLASQPNYMLADDHEVVNGFALDGKLTGFQRMLLWLRGHGGPRQEQYAELTRNGLKAYQEFQGSHAPTPYGENAHYYSFAYGKHQFFAMDTRFERINEKGQMISPAQLDTFFQWLTEHRDVPKFVITSSPFVMEKKDPEEKWSSPEFSAQRHQIIDFLVHNEIENLTFLCGDIHASGHAEMQVKAPNGRQLSYHELCASPVNGTKQRGLDEFHLQTEVSTAQGVSYRTRIDADTFVGKEFLGGISNSAVMKIHVNDRQVDFEIHRTRQADPGAYRSGGFRM